MRGESTITGGIGVHGEIPAFIGTAPPVANTFPNTTAIHGVNYSSGANGIGVYGHAVASVYGVYGLSDIAGGAGVRGDCTAGYGVLGSVSGGYGVLGQATTGNGLRGFSQQNHAVVGQTAQPYFGGVFGLAALPSTVGIYGSTKDGNGVNVASAYAGYMDGNFVVANGFKSAAVAHQDGSHRLVYCMESPESWFEDFGKAKLVGGKAEITLDPAFAAIVQTDDYHVFLTTYGESNGLFIARQTASGFAVQERGKGASSLSFSYRIVAKRKDIQTERLAKFDLPGKATHDAKPPQIPPSPTAVKRP